MTSNHNALRSEPARRTRFCAPVCNIVRFLLAIFCETLLLQLEIAQLRFSRSLEKQQNLWNDREKKTFANVFLRLFLWNKHALACTRKVNLMTLMRRERDTTQHSTPDHIECNLFTLESTRANYEQTVVYKLRLHLRSRRFNYFKIEASGTDLSKESFVFWCEKGSNSLQLSGAINSGDS